MPWEHDDCGPDECSCAPRWILLSVCPTCIGEGVLFCNSCASVCECPTCDGQGSIPAGVPSKEAEVDGR